MTNSSQSSFSISSADFSFFSIKSYNLFLIEFNSLLIIYLNSIFQGISVCKNFSSKMSLMFFASASGTFETSTISSCGGSLDSIGYAGFGLDPIFHTKNYPSPPAEYKTAQNFEKQRAVTPSLWIAWALMSSEAEILDLFLSLMSPSFPPVAI